MYDKIIFLLRKETENFKFIGLREEIIVELDNDINRIKVKMKEKGMVLKDVVDIKAIREFQQRYNVMLPEELVLFY